MDMNELDRQTLNALSPTCPKCGAILHPVIVNGVATGFDCLDCEENYTPDNIHCG